MKNKRPYLLTIAGFDPSGGAGLVADIKTFEQLNCYGLSVCTANTIQNDINFDACYWMPIEQIKAQITLLFNRFTISFVKIGIIENWSVLEDIVNLLLKLNPAIKIILDPILKSSSNYEFHQSDKTLDKILKSIFLITPNYEEIQRLYINKSIEETIEAITSKTNLLLKGGHREDKKGIDELYIKNGNKTIMIESSNLNRIHPKHGSGCVLSSSITSYLALNYSLVESCQLGKKYIDNFLSSSETLLGIHTLNK